MSRLVVVSNRVIPVSGSKAVTADGLGLAVLAALRDSGGIWFGWSGDTIESVTQDPIAKVFQTGKITYITIDLLRSDRDRYGSFANRTLWPLFHYRLDLSSFDRDSYISYRRVNQLFAEQLYPYLRDDDLVWVHDYHLVPIGEELRRLGVKCRLGFFLHIPLPSAEVYVALPWHDRLMQAFCAYDLIGFQTSNDLRNFHDYLYREGVGYALADGLVCAFNRTLRAQYFPVGIDAEEFARMAFSAEAVRESQRLSRSLLGRKLIIGVDRLDYSKGITERLRAYETLLENYPRQSREVTFVQISVPSREDAPAYVELRRQLEETSGRINGRFSRSDWMPLRYINRGFTQRTLSGFFRISQIGLVTPLRDGMNLVAKEYIAAQPEVDPGVLVLSRFAGAADELDGALIVNPYDLEAVAEAMHLGLTMPLDERQDRWRRLLAEVKEHDVGRWRQAFVDALAASTVEQSQPIHVTEQRDPVPELRQPFAAATPKQPTKYRKQKQRSTYYTCFLSHSSKDGEFARRLYADLLDKRVGCWFAPEDLKVGEHFRDTIEQVIRLRDKLLLVLSENSIESQWVEDELEAALEEEKQKGRSILFPVRIDDAILQTDRAWARAIRRTRHICDFTLWRDHDAYRESLDRLLRDLRKQSQLAT